MSQYLEAPDPAGPRLGYLLMIRARVSPRKWQGGPHLGREALSLSPGSHPSRSESSPTSVTSLFCGLRHIT